MFFKDLPDTDLFEVEKDETETVPSFFPFKKVGVWNE